METKSLDLWSDSEILAQVQQLKELAAQRNSLFEKVIANPDGARFVEKHEQLATAFEKFRQAYFELVRRRNADVPPALCVTPENALHRLLAETGLRWPNETLGLPAANGHGAGVVRTALVAFLQGVIADSVIHRNDSDRATR